MSGIQESLQGHACCSPGVQQCAFATGHGSLFLFVIRHSSLLCVSGIAWYQKLLPVCWKTGNLLLRPGRSWLCGSWSVRSINIAVWVVGQVSVWVLRSTSLWRDWCGRKNLRWTPWHCLARPWERLSWENLLWLVAKARGGLGRHGTRPSLTRSSWLWHERISWNGCSCLSSRISNLAWNIVCRRWNLLVWISGERHSPLAWCSLWWRSCRLSSLGRALVGNSGELHPWEHRSWKAWPLVTGVWRQEVWEREPESLVGCVATTWHVEHRVAHAWNARVNDHVDLTRLGWLAGLRWRSCFRGRGGRGSGWWWWGGWRRRGRWWEETWASTSHHSHLWASPGKRAAARRSGLVDCSITALGAPRFDSHSFLPAALVTSSIDRFRSTADVVLRVAAHASRHALAADMILGVDHTRSAAQLVLFVRFEEVLFWHSAAFLSASDAERVRTAALFLANLHSLLVCAVFAAFLASLVHNFLLAAIGKSENRKRKKLVPFLTLNFAHLSTHSHSVENSPFNTFTS